VGAEITVTGLASYDNSFDGPAPRIRIRDRKDVVIPIVFEDVKEGQWFHDAVYALVGTGIIKGVDSTHFDPDGLLTRSEWVTMLYRAAGSPDVTEACSFTDIPADAFYADAFAWAEDVGVVTGMPGGLGAPNSPINREQMVTMLYRFDGKNHVKYDLSAFNDVDTVSYFAFDAFEWAVSNGYINGLPGNILAPMDITERSHAATFLARYLGII
jgi:hypothetical protein